MNKTSGLQKLNLATNRGDPTIFWKKVGTHVYRQNQGRNSAVSKKSKRLVQLITWSLFVCSLATARHYTIGTIIIILSWCIHLWPLWYWNLCMYVEIWTATFKNWYMAPQIEFCCVWGWTVLVMLLHTTVDICTVL